MFTVRFRILLTNGFRSSFQIPKVRHKLGNFITQLSIRSGNLNQVVNFAPNFGGKLPSSLRGKFTLFGQTAVGLVIIIEMNPFTVQGKAIPSSVREKIIESWLEGKGPTQMGKELRLQKETIANIVDNFVRRGNSEAEKGGNNTRLARTDDVNVYIEYCKKLKPSIYSSEIQNKLVEDNVCLPENVPSRSSISRSLKHDLGYSYKKISVIPQESLTPENENRLFEYLTVCATIDPRTMHFFDESSVVKTTGNRHYGHSRIGHPALEVQRYASNATFTFELLNFFAEALEKEDFFGNPLLKVGDTVIMDNCGFHHARHVEPVLRNMLAAHGIALIYQPPYHPQYNTCEHCFRQLKGWLRRHSKFAEVHTDIAIFQGLSTITPGMSRNFFKHCGYVD